VELTLSNVVSFLAIFLAIVSLYIDRQVRKRLRKLRELIEISEKEVD